MSTPQSNKAKLNPHPSHRLVSGKDSRFLDATGRHVVLDLDGFGYALDAPGIVWEGVDSQNRFDEFCTAVAGTPETKAWVLLGPSVGDLDEAVNWEGDCQAAGWFLSGAAVLDESGEVMSNPPLPAPFFHAIRGSGQVVWSPNRWALWQEFSISDARSQAPCWSVQNISEADTLSSRLADGSVLCHPVASHLNEAFWDIALPPGCHGVRVECLKDVFHGRQRARVMIDGQFAGWWSEPTEDRVNRWRWSAWGRELEPRPEERTIRIGIDPPAGAPLWSVARYRVFVTTA